MICLICIATCIASTLSPLERSAQSLSSFYIGSYLAFEDYRAIVAPIMHRVSLLLNDQGQDIIEELRLLIKVDTRNEAINHFFYQNVPEISSILRTSNDIIIALAISRVSPELLAPLTTVIATYIANKRALCMFDELPVYFRNAENFPKLFTTVDPHAFPVTVASLEGHVTGLPGRAADYNLAYSLDRRFIKYGKPDGSLRFIDTREGCALDVNPGHEIHFVPGTRSLLIRSGRVIRVWHRDSTKPEVLPLADDAVLIGLYRNKRVNGNVAVVTAVGASMVAYEVSLGETFSFLTYPENAALPGNDYNPLESADSLTFRDSSTAGKVLVFTRLSSRVVDAAKQFFRTDFNEEACTCPLRRNKLVRLNALLEEDDVIESWRVIEAMDVMGLQTNEDICLPEGIVILHAFSLFIRRKDDENFGEIPATRWW